MGPGVEEGGSRWAQRGYQVGSRMGPRPGPELGPQGSSEQRPRHLSGRHISEGASHVQSLRGGH